MQAELAQSESEWRRIHAGIGIDTPEAIALAERLVAANDLPDPEVMLEVQVLEVSADRTSNLGLKFPESFSLSTPSTATTLGALRGLGSDDLTASSLSLGLNLLLQDTDTNILASPRIRARNKEKARILVGDKVPVITNLISPQQNGANSVITGSVQYVDVGIKLEGEPQVYADADVGIKVNLEVSNIARTITTASPPARIPLCLAFLSNFRCLCRGLHGLLPANLFFGPIRPRLLRSWLHSHRRSRQQRRLPTIIRHLC